MSHENQHQGQEITLTKEDTHLEHPPMFRVLLHNDDYTTREFVVMILRHVFNHSEAQAVRVMLNVHRSGMGVAGIYPHEVAETKVHVVAKLAEAHEFPLKCTMEAE